MSRRITPAAGAPSRSSATTTNRTRALLACRVVAGPLFLTVAVLQALTRDGFDPSRHPLSLLSLGELGWIQITNFVLAGLPSVASAMGLRQVLQDTVLVQLAVAIVLGWAWLSVVAARLLTGR